MGSEVVTKEGFKLYFHLAENKKFKETVVFVHHMGGNHKTTRRHYKYLNEQGFDCVSFDLLLGAKHPPPLHPFLKYLYRGVFYLWTKQIHSILDSVEGDKIIFAFSGPSLSALWATEKRKDIKKFICDGGPFSQIYKNTKNYFRDELHVTNKYFNSIGAFIGTSLWGYRPLTKLYKVLKNWPKEISILSIRGVEDNIVDINTIREIFTPHSHLDLKVLELEEGKHLDGMREFPEDYKQTLFSFITN